jgi:hypothetical protein
MRIQFVIVAFHSHNHIQRAIMSFFQHFPEQRLLVIDNNPLPNQTFQRRKHFNWVPECDEERNWLKKQKNIIVARPDINKTDVPLFHGDGLNFARKWCMERGFDAMCHFEPDSLIRGRDWFMKLKQGIEWDNWMCGTCKLTGHGIHPCPSLWVLEPTKDIDFNVTPKGNDIHHPRYEEVVGPGKYAQGSEYFIRNWDTGAKLWFECAIQDKAICNGYLAPLQPDIIHFWNGSVRNARKYTEGQIKLL